MTPILTTALWLLAATPEPEPEPEAEAEDPPPPPAEKVDFECQTRRLKPGETEESYLRRCLQRWVEKGRFVPALVRSKEGASFTPMPPIQVVELAVHPDRHREWLVVVETKVRKERSGLALVVGTETTGPPALGTIGAIIRRAREAVARADASDAPAFQCPRGGKHERALDPSVAACIRRWLRRKGALAFAGSPAVELRPGEVTVAETSSWGDGGGCNPDPETPVEAGQEPEGGEGASLWSSHVVTVPVGAREPRRRLVLLVGSESAWCHYAKHSVLEGASITGATVLE